MKNKLSTAKWTGVNAPAIVAKSDESLVYALSEQQIEALLSLLVPAHWSTRWESLPNDFDFKAFVSELENTLMQPLDICELVSQCIRDGNVDGALKEWMQGTSGGTNGNTALPIVYNRPTIGGGGSPTMWGESCDNDNLFAMITGLVDLTHTTIVDLAQMMELSTNSGEQLGNAIDSIPILGELPYADLYTFVDNFLSNLGESYDAAYTEILRNRYRCDLFCLASANCGISFEDFADYFANRVSTTISNASWLDVVNLLISGTWFGDILVDAAHYLVFAALSYGSSVIGLNVPFLSRIALSLMNDTDPDWATLCDDCPEPVDPCALPITIDFADGLLPPCVVLVGTNSAIDMSYGNPAPSNMWTNGNQTGFHSVAVKITLPIGIKTASVSGEHLGFIEGSPSLNGAGVHTYYDASDNVLYTYSSNITSAYSWQTKTSTHTNASDIAYIIVSTEVGLGGSPKDVFIALDNVVVS